MTLMAEEPRMLHVVKFGGTSVQNAEALGRVEKIVAGLARTQRLVVVLSAMGGVTDLLLDAAAKATTGGDYMPSVATFGRRHLEAARALLPEGVQLDETLATIRAATDELELICKSLAVLREKTPRILDLTVARGERLLARIFHAVLCQKGHAASYVDAPEIVHVQRQFGAMFPDLATTGAKARARLLPLVEAGQITIVPGYIGSGPDGELVTLGRGGSDLTATVLASGLGAAQVTLYKEVDGLLTADPRYVREARIVPEVHFREAAELAYYGAKVLHPRSIIPLLDLKIPLFLKNTFRPDQPGTRIAADVAPGAFPVKALTASFNQSLIAIEGKGMMGVPGIAGRAFQALAQAGISVSVITQASSEASICFVVADFEAKTAVTALEEAFRFEIQNQLIDRIGHRDGQAVLAVVGLGMKGTPGIAARTFAALARAEANIEAIAQGSSELNISLVIEQSRAAAALASLHREFRLEKLHVLPAATEQVTHWALNGVGQIGRMLVRQMLEQHDYFKDKMSLDLKCLALADSNGVVCRESGFGRKELEELVAVKERGLKLEQAGSPTATLSHLWSLAVAKGVFVDATAEETAPLLLDALEAGWHVVVANKKPLAVAQEKFDELFETARSRGVYLRYEATVGAGLPILDTLAKLEEAGDEVRMIAGCFSGTLGYLMTELESGTPFAQAVGTAHALGYTEPDPREDLSGLDVARKALILARTLGLCANLGDIAVEPLFPAACSHDDPKVFVQNLASLDQQWSEALAAAKRNGKVLRYVATISRDGIRVGVEAVAADSPLGRLKGTDNQVTVTTRRYDQNPLIVSGPGAGAAVTASGVLNDILAIATAAGGTGRPRKGR
jgi:aspartokinase/homoserine dehydrogenase 1